MLIISWISPIRNPQSAEKSILAENQTFPNASYITLWNFLPITFFKKSLTALSISLDSTLLL